MQLTYDEYGDGHPLVILHGLLGTSGNWYTLASRHFAERFKVYTVDQRNHGRSPHSDRMDYPSMADDLRDFMDERGAGSMHVLGHSMGGKTAMWFALSYPERVDRLVVVDMGPKAYPPAHLEILRALGSVDLTISSSRQHVDDQLKQSIRSSPVRQFLLKNLAYDRETGKYTWQMNLQGIAENYQRLNEAIEHGGTFDGPALFVRGSRSEYVTDDDVPGIERLFPNARVETLDAGHWVHADAPDAFARVVLDFLEEDGR